MDSNQFDQAIGQLTGLFTRRTEQLPEPVRALHRRIIKYFADAGRPPAPDSVRGWAKESKLDASKAIAQLVGVDVIQADSASLQIHGSYPFVDDYRGHRVYLHDGATVNVYCAIDALGIAPMLDHGTTAVSQDPQTGEVVTVSISSDGKAKWEPAGAVASMPANTAQLSITSTKDCCADDQVAQVACPTMNFYRDADAAAEYQKAHGLNLEILTIPQAIHTAQAIFGDLLDTERVKARFDIGETDK
jgi:hypothetical protein